jgi:hypothetical protein
MIHVAWAGVPVFGFESLMLRSLPHRIDSPHRRSTDSGQNSPLPQFYRQAIGIFYLSPLYGRSESNRALCNFHSLVLQIFHRFVHINYTDSNHAVTDTPSIMHRDRRIAHFQKLDHRVPKRDVCELFHYIRAPLAQNTHLGALLHRKPENIRVKRQSDFEVTRDDLDVIYSGKDSWCIFVCHSVTTLSCQEVFSSHGFGMAAARDRRD